jgi:phage shock protein A
MQARAGAIDELLASGALNDPTGTSTDDIQLELDRMSSTSDVESQLAAMKGQLAGAPATPAIEGTTAAPAAAPAAQPAEQPAAAPEESS